MMLYERAIRLRSYSNIQVTRTSLPLSEELWRPLPCSLVRYNSNMYMVLMYLFVGLLLHYSCAESSASKYIGEEGCISMIACFGLQIRNPFHTVRCPGSNGGQVPRRWCI